MALIYIDGFDHYNSITLANHKGWLDNGDAWNTASGRFPPGACVYWTDGRQGIRRAFPATYTTMYVGVAMKLDALHTTITPRLFGIVRAGAEIVKVTHIAITGLLRVVNSAGTVLGTSTTAITPNAWAYYELKAVAGTTTGSIELRVNGVSVLTASNVDTGTSYDGVYLKGGASTGDGAGGITTYFDDLYACDETGTTANGFLGDVKVETLYPNGDGSSTDWVRGGTDSGSNWGQVDESAPNADTDYVASMSSNHKDLYSIPDLSTMSGSVYGAQLVVRAKKDDAGMRKIQLVARTNATESSSSDISLSSDYLYYTRMLGDKPGGTGWTIAEVNTSEFGMKVSG